MDILRRMLRPVLVKFGQPKSDAHAFRRFRNTYLKNRTSCPEGVRQFHCNCLILGEVARPERFELPAFWFVVEKSGNPKALQKSQMHTHPLQKSCLSWSTSWYTRVPGS